MIEVRAIFMYRQQDLTDELRMEEKLLNKIFNFYHRRPKIDEKDDHATEQTKSAPPHPDIRDGALYRPLFSPWLGLAPFPEFLALASRTTLVSPDRCFVLYSLAIQSLGLPGDFWETGVYRGGTASLLREVILRSKRRKVLRLFDTFEGMPESSPDHDFHKKGDFSDTSLEAVRAEVGDLPWIHYHKGFIPDSFSGLENEIVAFAHIDVDLYRSVLDSCAFIYPRMAAGGFLVFDDYGFPSCPGAREAVDEFFSDKPEVPLVLPTGQAIVFKMPATKLDPVGS